MLLERIDEGLALLKVRYGFPFRTLPYLRENRNTINKVPEFPMELQKQIQSNYLKGDMDLYHAASRAFDASLASLSNSQMELFNQTLLKLHEVNRELYETCEKGCEHYESLSAERKQCDNVCVEGVLDSLED
jgi:hypothetical protein